MHRNSSHFSLTTRTGTPTRRFAILIAALALVSFGACAAAADSDVSAINARVIREHHDLLNKGDWKNAARGFAEDAKNFGRPVGRPVLTRILGDIFQTFPDFKLEIVDLVARGDTVVVRCKASGTHLGVGELPVNGGLLVGVPPTGKHFEIDTVHWYTLRDGKISDHRGVRDDLGMMVQLGIIAPPKPFDWAQFAREAAAAH